MAILYYPLWKGHGRSQEENVVALVRSARPVGAASAREQIFEIPGSERLADKTRRPPTQIRGGRSNDADGRSNTTRRGESN